MKKLILLSLLGGIASSSSAILINGAEDLLNPAKIIDPLNAVEDVDVDASGATAQSALEGLSDIQVLYSATGIDSNSASNVFNFTDATLPDIRLTLAGAVAAGSNIGHLGSNSYKTSGAGDAFGWSGTDGQVVTIEFGTWDGGAFVPGAGVMAAGLTFANFGGAYDTASDQTITYLDAFDNVLSTQVFAGGADVSGGREAYSGYLSDSYNISKITFAITRNSGTSSIGIDDIAFTAVPEPSTYAIYAGLLALGLAMWRRKFQD
jgi:hypothetical protein